MPEYGGRRLSRVFLIAAADITAALDASGVSRLCGVLGFKWTLLEQEVTGGEIVVD